MPSAENKNVNQNIDAKPAPAVLPLSCTAARNRPAFDQLSQRASRSHGDRGLLISNESLSGCVDFRFDEQIFKSSKASSDIIMMKLADEKDDTREHPKKCAALHQICIRNRYPDLKLLAITASHSLPPRIQEPLDDSRIVPCSSLLIASRCREEKKRKWDASISLINTHDNEEKHLLVTDAKRPIEKDLLRDVLLLRCAGNNERSPREGSCCTVVSLDPTIHED
ncbi:hypothetical protein BC629DRAFT_919827 [Irpex lacteus]|nr:hypothetical protein BC629DRAFT_919827 [Irpex lacteus]